MSPSSAREGRSTVVSLPGLLRVGGLAFSMLLLTACSADESAQTPPSPSSAAVSTSTPAVDPNGFPLPERPDCAAHVGGHFISATTTDGNGVGILVFGQGASGIVLGPQDDGDICQWLPYARTLAMKYQVALFDWADPRSEVPLLAVDALRDAGVRKVVLGGASYGGALAMSEAHRVTPRLVGVLSLGGETTLPGFDGRPGIRRWHGPLLAIGSENDYLFNNEHARQLRSLHPGPETVLMLPGRAHGVELLHGPNRAKVDHAIDRYLRRVLG